MRGDIRMEPDQETDVVSILRSRARRQPDRVAFTFLRDDVEVANALTFAELDERAREMAARFRQIAAPGDRVLLLYPPGLDYVVAFYGCLYAGIIGVPLYAPQQRFVPVIEAIAQDCTAKAVLATERGAQKRSLFAADSHVGNLPWLATDTPDSGCPPLPETGFAPDTIAYLQYTSGSTSTPKGVVIDHANIVEQCAELVLSWQVDSESRLVTWLPHFHDFGQVGAVLLPVYVGCESVRMAPATFVQRPIRWLEAVSRYRGTHTAAPNFAFDLSVDGTSEEERAGLDLSTLIMACNGAEPVRLETLRRFQETFAGHGLGANAVCPGYGLAEATLKVTTKHPAKPLGWATFDAAALSRLAVEPTTEPTGRALIGCGTVEGGTLMVIVDPATGHRLPPGRVGEIWVSGSSVARGYWERPDATAASFGARIKDEDDRTYLRTGDLGFVHQDEIYICGRIKDVVIVNGVNHYPQDIERTVEESHAAIRRGRTAAFSIESDGRDSVVVLAECARHDETPAEDVAFAIREAISRGHELAATVVIAETNAVPLTSSGKIQRSRCRAEFVADRLRIRHRTDKSPTRETPDTMTTESAPTPAALGSAAQLLRHGVRTHITDWLTRTVDGVQSAEERQPLSAHGVTSLHMMKLHQSLEDWTGVRLPHEWMWESESIDQLAGLIADHMTRPATPLDTAAVAGAGGDR